MIFIGFKTNEYSYGWSHVFLPYCVSIFSIFMGSSAGDTASVGAAVVMGTTREQSGPPTPRLQ